MLRVKFSVHQGYDRRLMWLAQQIHDDNVISTSMRHMASKQRRINVDATSHRH